MFIHVDEIQQHPEGVDFRNIILFIKTGQHYDLLKKMIDVDDVPCKNEEREQSDADCVPI